MTTTARAGVLLRHLRTFAAEQPGGPTDRQLLEQFAVRREEAAFAALVRRHAPLVLGVCRRVLRHEQDAEDAFQATFLVLARKARQVGGQGSVAGWLHRVAYHAALKARARTANRQQHERQAPPRQCDDLLNEVTGRELLAVLDEELQRLPEERRAPLVLCYLQGRTCDDAARQLGWSVRTLKRRLEQGRHGLRARLERRGLALPAGLLALGATTAAVPVTLAAAATRAALLTAGRGVAGGLISPGLEALAAGGAKAAGASKLRLATAALLAAGLLVLGGGSALTHRAQAQLPPAEASAEPPAAAPASVKEKGPPAPKEPVKSEAPTMTVSGRVLDPEGKPLSGARVAVCGRQGMLLNSWQGWASYRKEVLGQTKTDAEGNYRLSVPRTDPQMTTRFVRVVATADGHGLAWRALDPDADQAEAELRLTPVRRVSGRIVGLQGEGAAGVTIHAVRLTRPRQNGERDDDGAFRPPADLPLSATTDDKGNFVFAGFGPGLKLELEIRDPRYERKDEWFIDAGDRKQCENVRLVLGAGRCVEGRVVYEDTGKPVPHARLMFANPIVDAKADEQGRFKVGLFGPRDYGSGRVSDIGVHAYPPPGEPYVNTFHGLDFPRGVVRREVEVKLPRGVLVRGKVLEAGSGKPVAGAYVTHTGLRETYAASGPDGSYQLGVPAGAGRLLVTHPSGEYIPQIVGSAGGGINNLVGGSFEKPAGDPSYYHAVVALDVKKGDGVKEVNVTLRRGVTVRGRLVGPDDRPVASAVMFVSGHKPRFETWMHPAHVRGGRFEVRGLDPAKTYRLLFLEHPRMPELLMTTEAIESFGQLWLKPLLGPANKLGASVEVSPKKAGDEPVVKLAPCGSARVRFVDGAGKPLAGYAPWLQLVVTPGPPIHQALQDKVLAAEVVSLTGRYGGGHAGDLQTDKDGCVTFQGLIPGATYRLKKTKVEPNNDVLKDFSVAAGKTAELEVVVK
jgi:RNA polymerase sigma factor (sigma-70 family)